MTQKTPAPNLGDMVETDSGKWKKPAPAVTQTQSPGEQGGPKGPEPTRYGDWERKGIVSDF